MAILQNNEEAEFRQRTTSVSLTSFSGAGSNIDLYDVQNRQEPAKDVAKKPLQMTVLKENVPDGGFGWVIVVCVLFNLYCFAGLIISFAILLIAFKEAYPEESTGTLSLLLSVRQVVLYTGSLFASAPMKLYGLRATLIGGLLIASIGHVMSAFVDSLPGLFATFAVVTGVGMSTWLPVCLTIVQLYFDKRRALAAGIATAGFSMATLTVPMIIKYLLDFYTLKGVLLLLSILPIQSLVFASLFRPLPSVEKNPQKPLSLRKTLREVLKDITDFHHLKNPVFTFYMLSGACSYFTLFGLISHVPSRLVWKGYSKDMAALPMVFLGASGMCMRIVYSIVSNCQCVQASRTALFGCSILAGGILCFISKFIQSYWGLVTVLTAFSAVANGSHSIQVTVMVDIFGKEGMARRTPLLNTANGFGGLSGLFFTGWLFDQTQNYDIPFLYLGVVQMVGGIIVIILSIYNYLCKHRSSQELTIQAEDVQ